MMTIEELHDHLFNVLLVIDKICQENNLRYCLDGGTEIGAVREHDFIPWDDDMDICVLVEDYDTFVSVMKDNLPEHFHIVEPIDFSPYFYDNATRIFDDRLFIRKGTDVDLAYKNYQNHVGTDVFIYSGCPRSKLAQKLFDLKNKIFYGMLMAYRFKIDWSKYTTLQKVQIAVLRFIGRIYSGKTPDRIHKKRKEWIFSYNAQKTGFRKSVNPPLLEHYMRPMKNEWFFPVVNAEIRGKRFPVESGYDNKLATLYGDYMTPVRDKEKYLVHLETED